MKSIKKFLAAALAVTMLSGSLSFGGLAAETPKGWHLNEDGEWNFWKNGEMVQGEMITVKSTGSIEAYYLKDDGVMASDEVFQIESRKNGKDVVYTCYAFPEGKIAKNYWVRLDENDNLVSDLSHGYWYYFNGDYARLENVEKRIGSNGMRFYSFDNEGKMRSDTFFEKENEEGESAKYYYQHNGEKADNKWLNIGDDWYSFKPEGSCRTASDSNAYYEFDQEGALISETTPCRKIDSVVLEGDTDQTAPIGQEMKISFDVNLATDSNAKEQNLTMDHDYWLEESGGGDLNTKYKRTYELSAKSGKLIITYTALAETTVNFTAVIDGVRSEEVTVTSSWGTGAKADQEKTEAVNNLLLSGASDAAAAVNSIKELCAGITDSSQIKKNWVSGRENINALKQLDEAFTMINRNTVLQSATDAASALMGSGTVKLVGGSLNADRGSVIALTVDEGAKATLPQAYERQVSFALSLAIDGGQVSALTVPVVITMPVPKGMSPNGLKVYHIKADGTPELLDVMVVNSREVAFATDGFSDFVFAGNTYTTSDGGGGGGSSPVGKKSSVSGQTPETPGSWNQTADGKWQYAAPGGSTYANSWIYAAGRWYWINADSYMAQGWITMDGKQYYLSPESGAMQTGWVQVNDLWYFLESDGKMAVNTDTPDGYRVGPDGVWIK